MSVDAKNIGITGEPTSDPAVCKFTVDHELYAGGSVDCVTPEQAEGSPLLENLFKIEGVREVLVYGNSVTIAKTTKIEWPLLGKQIGSAIRGAIGSGKPLIAKELTERKPSDKAIRDKVNALLEEKINPYVSSHGGHIEVVDVKDDRVYVSLSGGCQGCASASMTLKQGVEQLVFAEMPQIKEVIDITDHSGGTNPYYR